MYALVHHERKCLNVMDPGEICGYYSPMTDEQKKSALRNGCPRGRLRLGEDGTLGIDQYLVPEYLRKYDPGQPLPKKVHELLIGYILVQFLEEKLRESAIIGFPAADGWKKHCPEGLPTLDWVLEHHEQFVCDTDVDIHVSSCGMTARFQVTRFVYAPDGIAHRRLAELIVKKCRHQQPDKQLHLVVSMENTPNITEEEIVAILSEISVPFRAIILIGKASSKAGHFSYAQLYPQPILGKEIEIPIDI